MSEQINELAKALSAFQSEMGPIGKNKSNPFFKSKYADLADILSATKELRGKHGLSLTQIPLTNEEGLPGVSTTLMHSSGQYIAGEHYLKPVKLDPQGVGSCLTYARRYAAAAILGIAADDDDDGNYASGNYSKGKPAPKPLPKKPAPKKPATKLKTPKIDMEAPYTALPEQKTAINEWLEAKGITENMPKRKAVEKFITQKMNMIQIQEDIAKQ